MSETTTLTDHEAVKKIHDLLKQELEIHGEESQLIRHLKSEHPKTYEGLISECKTHGLSIKGKIRDFVADTSKTLPTDRMQGVRKALEVVEERPELIVKPKSKMGWWVAGIASAVGLGAYIINQYSKADPTQSTTPPKTEGSWTERTQSSNQTDERAL